jgi:hypothetical protein
MKGLVEEGKEIIVEKGDGSVLDAALIGAAQKVEHYEIASYGTVRTLAQTLGNNEVAELLEETLDEEKEADQRLTQIAESSINSEAASEEDEGEGKEKEQEDGRGSSSRSRANQGSRGGSSKGGSRSKSRSTRRSRGRTKAGR